MSKEDRHCHIRQYPSGNATMRLSPKDPTMWGAMNVLGFVYLYEGDLDKAAEYYREPCRQPVTTYYPYLYLAATLKLLDRDEEAQSVFSTAMEMNRTFTHEKHLQQIGKYLVTRFERIGAIQALTDLGLPEA